MTHDGKPILALPALASLIHQCTFFAREDRLCGYPLNINEEDVGGVEEVRAENMLGITVEVANQ